VDELVIAVDPGREKCGVAVVHKRIGVLFKKVIDTAQLIVVIQELVKIHHITTIVLGDRTSSNKAREEIKQANCDERFLNIVPVDEHLSTEVARKRYWQENPPNGWKRFIPVTMQVPPVPVDDYVAVILAERYFSKLK